jgi:hypothetical protein
MGLTQSRRSRREEADFADSLCLVRLYASFLCFEKAGAMISGARACLGLSTRMRAVDQAV